MRRIVAAALLVAACGGSVTATTTTDGRLSAAEGFVVSADRALDGTRFADVPGETLVAVLLSLCRSEAPAVAAAASAVGEIEAPAGSEEDDAILLEVLLAGLVEVCPERAAADVSAAYLASVRTIVADQEGFPVDDVVALTSALSVCAVLDAGTPGDALVVIAASVFGIEADEAALLTGVLDPARGVTAGAVLASAVTYFCPEHAARVQEFVGALSGARPGG